MALRGTLTHWKTRLLAQSLGVSQAHALGILEGLWHATAEDAPAGDIGRLPNKAIAMQMYCDFDPDLLVDALLGSGHLDRHPQYRLLVHDWHQHADYNTKRKVARAKGLMHTVGGDVEPLAHDDASLTDRNASSQVSDASIYANGYPPEPEPEPELKTKELSSKPSASNGDTVAVQEVFDHYLAAFGRNPKLYKLTRKRLETGKRRYRELLKDHEPSVAIDLMKVAVDNLAASRWHAGENDAHKQYQEWSEHLFPSFEKLEFWYSGRGLPMKETA